MNSPSIEELFGLLPHCIVRTDTISRLVYAHDASCYRIVPQAIVHPLTNDDIQTLLWWSNRTKIPLTFRTAGTSLSGQAVTDGVIVDISRWKKLSIEHEGKTARISPGYIGGMVNARLKKYGRKLGPDPASINACMIGGIVANNASGMCCGVKNNSYHTLQSISYILPDGTFVNTEMPDAEERLKIESPIIYNAVSSLRSTILSNHVLVDKIRHKYRIKNTVGYGLNAFLDFEKITDIIGHLMVGSEGTLGFISEVVLETIPDKPYKRTALLYFKTFYQACRAIEPLKSLGAEALEIMDRASLRSIENDPICPNIVRILDDNSTALLVEFQCESEYEVEMICGRAYEIFDTLPLLEKPILTDDPLLQAQYWKIRKGMFPTVGAQRASGTGIINEDIAFPLEYLPEAVSELHDLFAHYSYTNAIVFGHAKDGNLHFVISQAFDSESDKLQYKNFMDDLAKLVITKYQGSLKAEHGTGRNIAPYVEMEWGRELYSIMKNLKKSFDPNDILNPGIIINDNPHCHVENLKPFPTVDSIIDTCIECGFCEHKCPSNEITLTPRQRIVLERERKLLALSHTQQSQQLLHDIENHFTYSVIDTCATDGLCETVCPVHINTGEYVKNQKKIRNTVTVQKSAVIAARFFSITESIARKGITLGHFLEKYNYGESLKKYSKILSKKTQLALPSWSSKVPSPTKFIAISDNPEFVYLQSCTTRLMGKRETHQISLPEIIYVLCNRANINVHIPNASGQCCGMMWESKGVSEAEAISVEKLYYFLKKESKDFTLPILIDSSTCFIHACNSILEYHKMIHSLSDKPHFMDISDFLMNYIAPKLPPKNKHKKVALHIPCSLVKSSLSNTMINIAKEYSEEVIIPEFSGCCGFAGDKGFSVPELSLSATKRSKEELHAMALDGFYSSNTTCEIGMSDNSLTCHSLAYLLYETT
jgi:D-lactate dehydrogenase